MRVREVYDLLDKISPFETQEKWDNSGLLVGSFDAKVKQIVLSIDLDEDIISSYDEGTLFVVHHPLIFGKLTSLDFSKYPANLIQKIILKKQNLIAVHTNFDKSHLNRYVFEEVLGFNIDSHDEFVCSTNVTISGDELIDIVKKNLKLPFVKVVNKKESVESISITVGAGASLIDLIDSDCFLTGDIKYHDAIKALNQNLMLIEVGHYESEKFFAQALANVLKTLNISVIITQSKNPFGIF